MERRRPFREAWSVYRKHFPRVVAIAAGVHAIFTLVTVLLLFELGLAGLPVAALVWLTGSFWLQAPLAQLVDDVRAGRSPPPSRATFDRVLPHLNAINFAALLAAVGVSLGLYLFVLPGLILLTRWSLLVPVIVSEHVGSFEAFARSRDLVRGRGFRVFGMIAVTGLILLAAVFTIAVAGSLATDLGSLGSLGEAVALGVAAFLVLTLVTPFVALAWTMLYLALRADRPPVPLLDARRFPVGATLDEAWTLYKRRPTRMLALGALAALLSLAAGMLAGFGWWGAFLPFVTVLVAYVWLAGLLAEGLSSYDDASAGRWLALRLRHATHRAVPLLVVGVVGAAAFSTVLGLVLLVWWSVVAAAIVAEGRGVRDAVRRSRELVRGRARRVVKLVLLSMFVAVLVSLLLAAFLPPSGTVGRLVAGAVANAITAPYVALAWALMYRRLREVVDAEAPEPTAPAAVA